MRNLLFDTPWWLLAGLAVVAVTLLVSGNNRQDKNLKRGGLFFLGLLILLSLTSYFVDTDIEKVTKRTTLMVSSVEKGDWKTFESLLDPHIHFAFYDDRATLVEGAKQTAARIGLKSARVRSLQAIQDASSAITVNLDAISVQDATMDRPTPTSWRFEWEHTPDGWLLTHISPLANGQVTPDRVTERLARPR
jgi:hypothetical protein